MSKSCRTCKFAKWQVTVNGRRQFQYAGECIYMLPPIVVPDCVARSLGFRSGADLSASLSSHRRPIVADDGVTCPCYEMLK